MDMTTIFTQVGDDAVADTTGRMWAQRKDALARLASMLES
jgi:hypothetical protein